MLFYDNNSHGIFPENPIPTEDFMDDPKSSQTSFTIWLWLT